MKLQTCQSQDFLQFYFQGQIVRRGDPTARERFPSPATLPIKIPQGRGVRRSHHCPRFSKLHPLTHTEPALTSALQTLWSKSKPCQCTAAELTGLQFGPEAFKHSPFHDATIRTEGLPGENIWFYLMAQLKHHKFWYLEWLETLHAEGPHNAVSPAAVITAAGVEDSPEILQEHCGCGGGSGRGSAALFLMRAVRTKPCSVLAERKLLMRLDGVCRHYLAMTKSALFLFAHGGKNSTGAPSEKKASPSSGCFCIALLLFAPLYKKNGGRLQLYPGQESCSNCCEVWIAILPVFQDVARTGRHHNCVRF